MLWSYKYFFLQLSLPFNAVAGEQVTAQSQDIDFPLNVRGATTELSLANRIQLSDPQKNFQWSSDFVPFASLIGTAARNEIYSWLRRPYFLDRRQPLRAVSINNDAAPSAAGNVIFLCEKLDTGQQHIIPKTSKPYYVQLSWRFTGVANQVITALSSAVDYDLLILGATYSAVASTNTVRIYDDSSNYIWSVNSLRFEYFFGLQGNNQPVLWYPRPYFLPKNGKIRLEETNVAAVTRTDFVTFIAITI
jgi:hypothetical protein